MTAAEANVVKEQGSCKNEVEKDTQPNPSVTSGSTSETTNGKAIDSKDDSTADVGGGGETTGKNDQTSEGAKKDTEKTEESDEKKETAPVESGAGDDKKEASDGQKETTGATKEGEQSATVAEDKDPAVEATMYLIQGKRHILVQDFASAVDSLQKSCELLSAKFGDDAPECGEALLYYGKALLELHRKQSGALNEMDTPGEAEDSSEEEEDEEEGEEEEEAGDEEQDDEKNEADTSEAKAESSVKEDEEDLEKPDPALQDSKLDATEGTSKEDGPSSYKNEEDASSDLQIAFEVLDLAKHIFKRDAEKNAELYLRAADCLLSLGEVGLESDNYTQAIEDFEECLRIQQEMLPKDSRELAETNYQLGLTYSFVNKYDTSAAHFADAIQILELKISNLEKFIVEEKAKNENRGSLDDDPVWRAEREVEEIRALLPEIASKCEDAKEMQREKADGPKEQIINQMLNRTPEASPVKMEGKVNVISSNLIKRKRPLDEAEPSSAVGDKRVKDS